MNATAPPSAGERVRTGAPGPGTVTATWGVRDLTVTFATKPALTGVTLAVPTGIITAVVGGDGAGKSTLLRALAGLVRPAAGAVDRPGRTALGFVSAEGGAYRDLTVDENLAFAGGAYGMPAALLRERSQQLLKRTGLLDARTRLGGQLSGGMRQKLAVAMALLHRPPLLILDEPTTGIDPVSRTDLWRLFTAAAASGAAVLLSSTYIDEAERAASVCVLDRGRVLLQGPPDAIVDTVRDRIFVLPVDGPRPATDCWRRGAVWRAFATAGAAGAPAGARPAEADLSDAVIAAALGLTDGTAPGGVTGAASLPAIPPPCAPAAADTELLVEARGVTRRFDDFVAVNNADLQVRPGEIVGLLGANGAGKTTLIRMLLGLLRPSHGQIALFGEPPSRATRALLGYVPQGLGLWDDLSVAENLAFAAGAFGSRPPATLDPDLQDARYTLVRDLPLGLRRRLAFTAALAHEPRLLVLDEPTSGVDPLARARLWDTVRDATEGGAGALVTTHYMEEAAQCDRLVVLADGAVVAAGAVTDIVAGRTVLEIESDDWAAAFAALDDAGLHVALRGRRLRLNETDGDTAMRVLAESGVTAALRPAPATLEEAFVDIVTGGER